MKTNFKGTENDVKVLETSCGYCVSLFGYIDQIAFFEYYKDEKDKHNAELFAQALEVRQQIEFDLPELLERYNRAEKVLNDIYSDREKGGGWSNREEFVKHFLKKINKQ